MKKIILFIHKKFTPLFCPKKLIVKGTRIKEGKTVIVCECEICKTEFIYSSQ